MTQLSEQLNFTFSPQIVVGYGAKMDNGSWVGMVGEIQKGNIDLIGSYLKQTTLRQEIVSYRWSQELFIYVYIHYYIYIYAFRYVLYMDFYLNSISASSSRTSRSGSPISSRSTATTKLAPCSPPAS